MYIVNDKEHTNYNDIYWFDICDNRFSKNRQCMSTK